MFTFRCPNLFTYMRPLTPAVKVYQIRAYKAKLKELKLL